MTSTNVQLTDYRFRDPRSPLLHRPAPVRRAARLGERCLVMGILNVTPDSFADAVASPRSVRRRSTRALRMEARRRRPDRRRRRVDAARRRRRCRADEELARDPAGRSRRWRAGCACRSRSTPTRPTWRAPRSPPARRSSTTSAACGTIRRWRASVAERGAALVLMHTRGRSKTMYAEAVYDDVVADVAARAAGRASQRAAEAGVPLERIDRRSRRRVCQTAVAQLWCAGTTAGAGGGARPPAARRAVAQVVHARRGRRPARAPNATGARPPPSPPRCSPARTSCACMRSPKWRRSCASRRRFDGRPSAIQT